MSNETKKLSGKVALVTGASKGIGASIAKHLAAAGAAVVVNYSSSKDGADKVVAEIVKAGGKAVAIGGNVAKPEEIKSLLAETKKAYGKLDILVNNAGIYEFAPLEGITPEHFHKHFDLNVLGLLLTTQEAVKLFTPEGGSIINLSSIVTRLSFAASTVYAGTKAAVEIATRTLAVELGPRKIRVNAIGPGMVETEGVHTAGILDSPMHKEYVAKAPLGRIGQPADIASAVVFLASDDASWITGETLFVGGGYR